MSAVAGEVALEVPAIGKPDESVQDRWRRLPRRCSGRGWDDVAASECGVASGSGASSGRAKREK
ncbi:MAG: hypothetical protein ACXVJ2_17300 [Candidatus Angelobacter sp.]